jgi:hypothetical protein
VTIDGFAAATRGLTRLRMAELTSAETRQALAHDPVLLLPLGSFEDQGPHAPMGDFLSADAVAGRIAERATQDGTPCLVAPTLPFGAADFFEPSDLPRRAGRHAVRPAAPRPEADRAVERPWRQRAGDLRDHAAHPPR